MSVCAHCGKPILQAPYGAWLHLDGRYVYRGCRTSDGRLSGRGVATPADERED